MPEIIPLHRRKPPSDEEMLELMRAKFRDSGYSEEQIAALVEVVQQASAEIGRNRD